MSGFQMHSIKRQARKEAWYGDSMNPFRQTGRTSTWHNHNDLEDLNERPSSAFGRSDSVSSPATTQTELPLRRPFSSDGNAIRRASPEDQHEMTMANATSSDHGAKASIRSSITPRPPSQEAKTRWRFVSKFFRRVVDLSKTEDEDEESGVNQRTKWKKTVHKPFTVRNQIAAIIMVSWIRVLLLLTPVGFAVHYSHCSSTADFLVNFFAILPLTDMFGQALVELKTWAGDPRLELVAYILCGNINQTFTSALLLRSHQITVLKSTLLGGMLLRILLITSIAILTNDSRHRFQKKSVAVSLSKHLSIALTGLIIPTALSMVTSPNTTDILKQSRGVSFVLLGLYGLYLYSEWQVYSLLGLMNLVDSKDDKKVGKGYIALSGGHVKFSLSLAGFLAAAPGRPRIPGRVKELDRPENYDELIDINALNKDEENVEKEPQLHFWNCVLLLFVMGALLALHILFISDSLVGFTQETGTTEEFIGLILLPILGLDSTLLHLDNRSNNETVAQTTLGLGLQTILFMMPLVVLVGWAAGIEGVDLLFSPFEVTVLFPAVLVVQSSIEENDKGWSVSPNCEDLKKAADFRDLGYRVHCYSRHT
ncbi:Ca(2+)/H(+) antiporter [Lachnellula hyalina]|uniref:Ca(2+)/H(+) antiporter n=1 Tax=Lachnellula hyalina TaxID=1316788 RepID=A0A8H8TXB8_9HELO|nr:Ca(2+)/H(+) antiporter [Lachnellula hyalina]TVY24145.1 Ca(2+)/H(+) antiporter [Lachnellula hyalina]